MKTIIQSVNVNTAMKAHTIVNALRKQGRKAFYEEFYSYDGKFYSVYYLREV